MAIVRLLTPNRLRGYVPSNPQGDANVILELLPRRSSTLGRGWLAVGERPRPISLDIIGRRRSCVGYCIRGYPRSGGPRYVAERSERHNTRIRGFRWRRADRD